MLVLAISSVVHVETRTSAGGRNLLLARQNALLGLDNAIAQLQQYAGKDQAVTFPATTFYPTKNVTNASGPLFDDATFGYRAKAATAPRKTFLTPAERTAWDTALKTWWSANRNPRWTGIADASLRRDGTASDKFGEPKRDQLPVWLVSGNEQVAFDPATATSYPAGYLTPDTAIPDPGAGNTSVWLVGEGTATNATASTDGLDGRVKAPSVEIKGADNAVAGHYAYWVGDESTKANFAVRDPWFSVTSTASADYRNRLQVPQHLGWENIAAAANNTTNLGTLASFGVDDARLENISTSKEIGLLEAAASSGDIAKTTAMAAALKNNFHSLTAFSRSLLTDTALGGLKKDLSVFLENGGGGLAGPIPNRSLYVSDDPRFGGTSNNGFPRVATATTGLPTWADLKAWHDNDAGTRAPVLANFQIFVAFTHKNGEIQFHLMPIIAMWNPYDTALPSATYTLKIRHNFTLWKMGFAVENSAYVDPMPDDTNAADTDGRKAGNYFVSPLVASGWYAGATKYSVNFKNATDSANNLWRNGFNEPDYRWAPFDLGSSPLPAPTNPNATWVSYTFTSGFGAGEVRVFTVGTSQQVDAGQLHSGAQSIALVNDFEPDFPASAYFPIATGLQKQPGVAPASTDVVRWFAAKDLISPSDLTLRSFPMNLERGGMTLWEYSYTGAPGYWFKSENWSSNPDPDPNLPGDPSTWKRVYHLDDWIDVAKGTQDTRRRESPIMGMVNARISPFLIKSGTALYSGGNYQQGGLGNYHRVFAHSNLSARSLGLMDDLDYARADRGNNNADGFATRQVFDSHPNQPGTEVRWDYDQVAGNLGYTLLGWQSRDDTLKTSGLANVPLRQARAAFNVLSLGQFQQANLSPYYWQPAFAMGNSEASPYVDRNRAAGLQSYQVRNALGTASMLVLGSVPANTPRTFPNDASNRFLDMSFTLNEGLWDRYFISSIPQNGALATDNTQPLPNSRHRFVNSPAAGDVRNFDTAAAHLENVGALNVNTTSEDTWKSLLTAFRDLAIVAKSGDSNPDDTVPVSRNLEPLEGPVNFLMPDGTTVKADYGAVSGASGDRDYSKLFFGFRYLTDAQIASLAARIVDEVRLRGPFYSLADFVNRRLVSPDATGGHWLTARTSNLNPGGNFNTTHHINAAYDPIKGMAGLNGALQRAINVSGINGGVNYPLASAQYDRAYAVDLDPASNSEWRMQQYSEAAGYLDSEHLAGVPAGESGQLLSHAPGFVTQADILAMIGPALTPRGDTFLVRSYGDVTDKSGKVIAKAWLEAVVQRTVDPVTPAGTTGADKFHPADNFGRKFKVVSLRWLKPEEV